MSFRTAIEALTAAGGTARTRTLLDMGVTARELARARRTGEIVRPRQGLYALPATSFEEFHAAAHGGVPASLSAARIHDLWALDDGRMHVWMGASGRRLSGCEECCVHWSDGPMAAGALPSIPRTLLQIAQCSGEEAFFAALESALRQSLIPPEGLDWLRERLPGRMRWLVSFAARMPTAASSRSCDSGCAVAESTCAHRW